MKAAIRAAGYSGGSLRLRRYGFGWELAGTADHPDRPYVTTTGTSCTYSTRWWDLTLFRLVGKVEDGFARDESRPGVPRLVAGHLLRPHDFWHLGEMVEGFDCDLCRRVFPTTSDAEEHPCDVDRNAPRSPASVGFPTNI